MRNVTSSHGRGFRVVRRPADPVARIAIDTIVAGILVLAVLVAQIAIIPPQPAEHRLPVSVVRVFR